MSERLELTSELKSKDFLDNYWLKEELVSFCRDNGLPASGGKQELTERIAAYLDTGRIERVLERIRKVSKGITDIRSLYGSLQKREKS